MLKWRSGGMGKEAMMDGQMMVWSNKAAEGSGGVQELVRLQIEMVSYVGKMAASQSSKISDEIAFNTLI